jgi:hypothetical protein
MPIHKWPICPISALREKFNSRNSHHMPAVKFFARRISTQLAYIWMGTEGWDQLLRLNAPAPGSIVQL